MTPVLVPYNQPHDTLLKLLSDSDADALIAAAGSIPLADLCTNVSTVRQTVWVVEETSRHMDWDGAPAEAEGNMSVSVWHDLIEHSQPATPALLPQADQSYTPGNVVTFWQGKQGDPAHIVEFTQKVIRPISRSRILRTTS